MNPKQGAANSAAASQIAAWTNLPQICVMTCQQPLTQAIKSAPQLEPHEQISTLLNALQDTIAAKRIEHWNALAALAQHHNWLRRQTVCLQQSHILLSQGVLQSAILVTLENPRRIEHLPFAATESSRTSHALLSVTLQVLHTAAIHHVEAHAREDDTAWITLLEQFGFTASDQTVSAPRPLEP
jgi:hypothetical protein